MKKLMCVVALMFGMSIATFGSDNRVFDTEDTNSLAVNYDINVDAKSLARYLELSEDQKPFVIGYQRVFEKSLLSASDIQAEPMRKAIVENAVKSNLRKMNRVLTKRQYNKYVRVLDLTLKNRHIVK